MRATLTMTLNDLRIFFSQRGNWLSLALLPVLFTVGLGFAFGGDSGPERLRVDVIDEDQSAASMHLLDELAAANVTLLLCPPASNATEEDDPCELEGVALTLARAQDRVREGDSNALIVIPAGYGDALTSMTPVVA